MFAQVAQQKDTDLKQHLLAKMRDERANFTRILTRFHQQDVHTEEDYLRLNKEIIAVVERLEAAGDWESSLFLRSTLKPFKEMQQRALEVNENFLELAQQETQQYMPDQQQQRVFILLYQAKGHDLHLWQLQLKSLPQHIQGRPIYQDEAQVKKFLRGCDHINSSTYAYIEAYVERNKLLSAAQPRLDKFGSELLMFKEGALKTTNIVAFYHNDQCYNVRNGEIIKLNTGNIPQWMHH